MKKLIVILACVAYSCSKDYSYEAPELVKPVDSVDIGPSPVRPDSVTVIISPDN